IVDQIVLLRGGCLEMLVLRSYFAFSCDENKYMSDKFQYQPSDFLQAGCSEEFVEKYNSLHLRMRKMKLQVEEICLLLALVLFSPDRPGLEEQAKVEEMQDMVANTLQAYEYTNKPPKEARVCLCWVIYR
uniref:NR LBD domain-containing protein n=1 Tax=Ciona savignyi TaxID=51511 RepID=H2ZA55_CIOSA